MRRLARDASARRECQRFVIEGTVLVDDVIRSPLRVESVLHTADAPRDMLARCEAALVPTLLVSDQALESVATTVTPQPVLAVAQMSALPFDRAMEELAEVGHVLILDGVQDPGNAGTILRSAEASGAALVVFASGSVDPHNPKVVRASAGSLFRQPLVSAGPSAVEAIQSLQSRRRTVYCATGEATTSYDAVELADAVFVMGNEANGVSSDAIDAVDDQIGIPQAGDAESLNVAMAATVLCFEAARQRRSSLGADNPADNLA